MARAGGTQLPTGVLTFLFSDVEASTRLLQAVGAERFGELIDAHHAVVRASLARNGGVEVSTEGDSFFAVFEDPGAAILAAAAIHSGLAAHAWPTGAEIRVRIGLHTGEGRLGGDSYVGIDVNRAARIAAAGHGGMTLLSASTYGLVGELASAELAFRDLGLHRLRDVDEPERLVQLVVAGLPDDLPPPRTLERPIELPAPLTTFVGRDGEVSTGLSLLADTRLLTLTGPGGTGKTRLSIEIARRAAPSFADGAWFVDLSTIGDAALVPSAIATALRMREVPQRSTSDALVDHVRDRSMLLVLDNFEQVLEARTIVGRILAEAVGVRVLASSREPLRLPGEREYAVPPLGLPDAAADGASVADGGGNGRVPSEAVALFLDRARSVRPEFAITPANQAAVTAIVRRLDGLPLAIELAAARTRVLAPAELLARLERSLSVLSSDAPLPDRQRTLEGAIAWSHDLLSDTERLLFARLSVFVGGATLESVEAVVADEALPDPAILDLVTALVERSLVRRMEAGGSSRFTMLETIREYAGARLAEMPDAVAVEDRHTAHFLELALRAEPHFGDATGPDWLDRLEADHDNLRAVLRRAVDHGPIEPGLQLAGAIWRFWQQRSHLREGRRWLTELLAVPDAATRTAARAAALSAEAGLLYWQGDMASTRARYEETLAIQEELGDRSGATWTLHDLAFATLDDPTAARELMRSALAGFRELDDRKGIASASGAIGYVSMMLGELDEAEQSINEAQRLNRELGETMRAIDNLSGLGQLERKRGRLERAEEHYREALRSIRGTGDATRPAMLLEELTAVVLARGDGLRAARLLGAVDGLRERLGGGLSRELMETTDLEQSVRAQLGPDAFDEAFQAGRRLDVDGAIGEALGETTDAPADGDGSSGNVRE